MARYQPRPLADSSVAPGGVAAVDRALLLLTCFREKDGALNLSELTQRTGLVKSTALRLLASLQHAGLVQRQDDGYSLGPGITRLQGVRAAAFDLGDAVLPTLRQLVARTRESAAFYVREGDRRLCLYRVDSPQPLRDHGRVGDLFPLDHGSGGRVLLAFGGAEGAVYDQARRDKVLFIAADRVPDLAGAAAPVFEAGGRLAGSLSLIMPVTRADPAHAALVREAAREITARIAGSAAVFDAA